MESNHELVGTAHPKRVIRPTALTFCIKMKRRSAIATLTVLTLFALYRCADFKSSVRSKLPHSATHVREEFHGNVDYSRYLVATISYEDFRIFAAQLGYTNQVQTEEQGESLGLNWGSFKGDNVDLWWRPSPRLTDSYFRCDKDKAFYSMIKHEDGRVYFVAHKF